MSHGVGNKKVLVVDDDEEILDLIAEFIPRLGCEVLRARDGEEALQIFRAEGPPLVLADLWMPTMDGLTLMKAVKEASPGTEILILTAHADLDSAIEAVRQGAFDYLLKPFALEALGRRVNQALERHRLVSEKEALLEELEERVKARTAALVESQRQLRAVFNGIRDSLVIVDQTFTIIAANEGAATLSGTPADTLIGRKCYRELCRREEICEGCPLLETLATGRAASASMSRRNRDGSCSYLEVSGYPLADAGKRPTEAVEHIRDVTEKIHQARDLHNSEKLAAVGQFAAGLAHELGNALAIIGSSAQFLLGYPGDRRRASRDYLEVIHRNVAAADRTIRELLAFARPREPFLRAMDVTESLDRACFLLRGKFAKHGVEVVQQYAPALPRIEGDPEQLQQVFLNLLLNAVQAMDDGGTITVRIVFDPPEWVRVELMDTGRGIPGEHLDRIFDPFFTTREQGTGLGLSIAHRHVEAHRGRLTVETQEGRGTRFTMLLPAKTPQSVRAGAG
ncbi:MAG: response regulator [Candidatus Rokubacteria bacterium]|nr:response regulator [Candidatus Rokubacteria bacterium]